MEGGSSDDIVEAGGGRSGGSTAAVGSRWNPTKEQISILESMYGQGVRTPSAEQIQEITTRLKAYGHIEGKNVFYWFQNHKARQRQKEKQESLAYLNRCLLPPDAASNGFYHPRTHSPCPNVVCGPYYVARSDVGFYTQHPKSKMLFSSNLKRPRERSSTVASSDYLVDKAKSFGDTLSLTDINPTPQYNPRSNGNDVGIFGNSDDKRSHETLDLFPVHPSGTKQDQPKLAVALSSSDNSSVSCFSEVQGVSSTNGQPFFDFFSG